MKFIAVDVETANEDSASICAVGLVHFDEGREIASKYFLIDPEDYFSPWNTRIHGIKAADVEGKPKLRDAFPLIVATLSKQRVAHHSPFDRIAFSRTAARYGLQPPKLRWVDTVKVARETWPGLKCGYGLKAIADKLAIRFQHHHALEDARACGQILVQAMGGASIANPDVKRVGQFENIRAMAGDPSGPLSGETIVFTGSLTISRQEAALRASHVGCDVRNSVTKATTILVVGDQDVRRIGNDGKSEKHRRAEEMREAGANIRIITEADFTALCGFSRPDAE